MPLPGLSGYLALYTQQRLQTDPTIRFLLGGELPPGDPRVYHYYESPAYADQQHPAFISWAELAKPKEVGGTTEPVTSLRIYSYDIDRVHDVEARVESLFERVVHTVPTTTSPPRTARTVSSIINAQDLYDQSNKFCGREVHVRYGTLTTAVI